MAVVFADRPLPDRLAGLRVERRRRSPTCRRRSPAPCPRLDQDRRVLEVPVVEVVRRLLVVPVHLAGLGVELDHRVGVEVGAGPARPPGLFGGARERRRVAGPEVHRTLVVERGRVPEAAAGVDFLVAPEALRARCRSSRLSCRSCASSAQRMPTPPPPVGRVRRWPARSRRRPGRRGSRAPCRSPSRAVAHQRRRPELFAGLLVEREGGAGGRAEDAPVGDDDAVRALVGLFVVLRPEHFAALEVDRLHVGLEVLRVDDAVGDHRRSRSSAVGALRGQRQRPGFFQLGDVGAVDRPADVAGVGEVDARIAGAGELERRSPEADGRRSRPATSPAQREQQRPRRRQPRRPSELSRSPSIPPDRLDRIFTQTIKICTANRRRRHGTSPERPAAAAAAPGWRAGRGRRGWRSPGPG